MMKHSILVVFALIFALPLLGQEPEGNQHLIDAVKTKESKENIEKWIAGYWKFVEMRTPEGKKVDTLYLGLWIKMFLRLFIARTMSFIRTVPMGQIISFLIPKLSALIPPMEHGTMTPLLRN